MHHRLRVLVLALAGCLAWAAPGLANETDQFTVPKPGELADLGEFLSRVHYEVLRETVRSTNRDIDKARKIRDPKARERALARLHSPRLLADKVQVAFGPGFFEMNDIEMVMHGGAAKEQFPGKMVAHRTGNWIYSFAHLPIDPRNIPLMFPSSSIRVGEVYFGLDKMGHFHDLGHIYFKNYLAARSDGLNHDDAVRSVVRTFTLGPVSEGGSIGRFATGVFSNADLAANYAGMKFFMNLTASVVLRGERRPPLLVRDGDWWRLNDHVVRDPLFFNAFVTHHFNEALNPCIYEWGLRNAIAPRVREMAPKILAFYADEEGKPRPREYFDGLARELVDYYGEDYGHTGMSDKMITIAEHCFPQQGEAAKPQRGTALVQETRRPSPIED